MGTIKRTGVVLACASMLSVGIGAASAAGAGSTEPASPGGAQRALCGVQQAIAGWPLAFGSVTHVLILDPDKFHHFEVEVTVALQNLEASLERANPGISLANCSTATTPPTTTGR